MNKKKNLLFALTLLLFSTLQSMEEIKEDEQSKQEENLKQLIQNLPAEIQYMLLHQTLYYKLKESEDLKKIKYCISEFSKLGRGNCFGTIIKEADIVGCYISRICALDPTIKVRYIINILRSNAANNSQAVAWIHDTIKNRPPMKKALNALFFEISENKNNQKVDDTLKLILQVGADINAQNDRGLTPLMQACCNADKDRVTFLIKQGANIHKKRKVKGSISNDALFYAMRGFAFEGPSGGKTKPKMQKIGAEIITLLLAHGATVNNDDLHWLERYPKIHTEISELFSKYTSRHLSDQEPAAKKRKIEK